MRVLGIETATQVCGIAITENARLIAAYRLNIKNVHSERIAGAIKFLLDSANWKSQDIEGIAVSIGPGSFTGLRIGLSVAKGMAFALRIPLTAVPTLEALVWQAPAKEGDFCTVLPARTDCVYAGQFEKYDDSVHQTKPVQVVRLDDIADYANPGSFFIGDGTEKITSSIDKISGRKIPAHYSLLSGLTIAILGTKRFEQGLIEDVHKIEPFYVQNFVPQKPKQRSGL